MFDLEETFTALQADSDLYWSSGELNFALQELLANEPESILNDEVWAQLLSTACPPIGTDPDDCTESLTLIIAGLKHWSLESDKISSIGNEEERAQATDACREALEKYFFLTRLHLTRLDADAAEVEVKSNRVKFGIVGVQIRQILAAISRTIQSALSTLYPPTMIAKRTSLALLYLEPTCKLLHNPATVLDKDLVREIIRVLSLGVKLQHQQQMVRTQMLQLLTYYDHAVNFVITFLHTLSSEFDYSALADNVLRDLTAEASTWKDSQSSANLTRAKTVNSFLVGISDCMPSIMVNNLPSIALLLASPFSKLRLGTIEVAPIIVKTIMAPNNNNGDSNDEPQDDDNIPTRYAMAGNEESPMRYKPAFELVNMITPRINDANHFVRAKAIWALAEICHERSMISLRETFSEIAVAKMMDKSQYVRKQAMSFMRQLIETHPQLMHPKNLSRKVWTKSLEEIDIQLVVTEPESSTYLQLEAGKAFVEFTLKFIKSVEDALGMAKALLNSRSKTDILDSISLLVYGDAYGVEASEDGIRSIVHLVWAKADNDENNQVSQTAVDTYHDLFLTAPPDYDSRKSAQVIAENLIYLTLNANDGTLTSLERLLVLALERDMIGVNVVSRLWGIYQNEREIDPSKRRGSAIVLSMLALADSSIARSGVGALINVGLKRHGVNDYLLAAYSFTILKRSVPPETSLQQKLPPNYDTFNDIIDFLVLPAEERRGPAWIIMAKEALSSIVALCNTPSKVYTRIVRKYLSIVFGDEKDTYTSMQRRQLFTQLIYVVGEIALNLLVFCERCELEFKEQASKDKGSHSSSTNNNEAVDEEELMASGASAEDDFQDILRDFRENIIFYSDRALLKPFTGMVTEICKSELLSNTAATAAAKELSPTNFVPPEFLETNVIPEPESEDEEEEEEGHPEQSFNQSVIDTLRNVVENTESSPPAVSEFIKKNSFLSICATQTLSKFMCVSSRFCEENLPLLVSLMTHDSNNVVRSNFVVALGDVAICFNRLIDDHTEFLYDRLNDSEEIVQRTCIVALTFLILAGQIKVKGKLGEIAKTIVHPNDKISSLAKMFFNELSSKENAIYNSYLDILSTLHKDVTLPSAKMNIVIRFLSQRLDKEKQMKKLTDKLVVRMKKAETEREWSACVQAINSMNRKVDDDIKAIISAGFVAMPGQDEEIPSDEDEEGDDDEDAETEQRPDSEHAAPLEPQVDVEVEQYPDENTMEVEGAAVSAN